MRSLDCSSAAGLVPGFCPKAVGLRLSLILILPDPEAHAHVPLAESPAAGRPEPSLHWPQLRAHWHLEPITAGAAGRQPCCCFAQGSGAGPRPQRSARSLALMRYWPDCPEASLKQEQAPSLVPFSRGSLFTAELLPKLFRQLLGLGSWRACFSLGP